MTRGYAAPQLAGYTFVDLIGQGGFADVFRYAQQRPARDVAIKVLTEAGFRGEAHEQFDAEAELMAQLASHPSIVPIYAADLSADGRPYLVMEYCSGPSLARRARTGQIPVPEVLDTAIRVAAAVETAHRAGILHRDVKPQNILTNVYGHPKLTDFGIAVVRGRGGTSSGVSIPWAPPELLGDQPTEDVRSDVYSLAATVFTLVAGRSPYEVVGGANDAHTLMSRIERSPVPRLVRPDVPERLQEVVRRGLAKEPDQRPATAMALARALQEVQIDLHLSPTKIDVLDASPTAAPQGEEDERTRVRPIKVIDPTGPVDAGRQHTGRPTTRMPLGYGGPSGPEFTGPDLPPAVDRTQRRTPTPAQVAGARRELAATDRADVSEEAAPSEGVLDPPSQGTPTATRPARRSRPALLGVAALLLLAVGGVTLALTGGDRDDRTARPTLGVDPDDMDALRGDSVPPVTDLRGVSRGDRVTFTWINPDPQKGDHFLYQVLDSGEAAASVDRSTVAFVRKAGTPGCLLVWLVRADGTRSPDQAPKCPVSAP